ncbi:MAG: hypothetical protein M3Y93_01595 [Pseudomonadota bacterium]|nr:hypothetical protein [Pseudomonadota bacterium]
MFARLASESADAAGISEKAVSIWVGVVAALSPIIGQAGVAALFKRSVFLTRNAHPCLSDINDGELSSKVEFAGLQIVLAQLDRVEAVAVNTTLLQNFHDLLNSLIGASLSKRLLRPVWDAPSSGDAVQETIQ